MLGSVHITVRAACVRACVLACLRAYDLFCVFASDPSLLTHQLLEVSLVGGFGHDALLLQHGQDAHLFLDQLDGGEQVHAEINEGPLDALGLVLFLLLDEHVVVEELLETLVGVVDEKLFQDVQLEDLEAGNVENACDGRGQRELEKQNRESHQTASKTALKTALPHSLASVGKR